MSVFHQSLEYDAVRHVDGWQPLGSLLTAAAEEEEEEGSQRGEMEEEEDEAIEARLQALVFRVPEDDRVLEETAVAKAAVSGGAGGETSPRERAAVA